MIQMVPEPFFNQAVLGLFPTPYRVVLLGLASFGSPDPYERNAASLIKKVHMSYFQQMKESNKIKKRRNLYTGFGSSCDETSAAVVKTEGK